MPKKGCHPSKETVEKMRASLQKYYEDPVQRKKISDARLNYFSNPDNRKRQSDLLKQAMGTPEARAKNSETKKKYFSIPGNKERRSELMKVIMNAPEVKHKLSVIRSDPALQQKMNTNHKLRLQDPVVREKISVGMKKYLDDYEVRVRISEAGVGGHWYGNVRDPKPQYCEKFAVVKPKVRAFFNRVCVECGKRESKHKHHVHHVFYDKKSCCLVDEGGIYYSNLYARDHTTKDYCIGENPNYFVLLCESCHGKISPLKKFESKRMWADHFKELIDTKYGGVCYTESQPLITIETIDSM